MPTKQLLYGACAAAYLVLPAFIAMRPRHRTGLLLTTLVPWRPPGSRAPNEAEVQACLPFLLRLIAITRPARLVLLGAAPAKALLGGAEAARRLRGRWQTAQCHGTPIPARPMLPLDQWLRSPATKRDTWADLLALRSHMDVNAP